MCCNMEKLLSRLTFAMMFDQGGRIQTINRGHSSPLLTAWTVVISPILFFNVESVCSQLGSASGHQTVQSEQMQTPSVRT